MTVLLAFLLAASSAPSAWAAEGEITRGLPASVDCAAGETFTVNLLVETSEETSSWVLDESPPTAINVTDVDASNSGDYSEDQHKVKWVSLSGGDAQLTYQVQVPAGTSNDASLVFDGEYRLHPDMEDRAPVLGDTTVACAPACPGGPGGAVHPHDLDKDGVLDDDDLFSLIDAWRTSDQGELDDLLFAGIDAWKLSPGGYC